MVAALAVRGGQLIVAGLFETAGSINAANIAAWDGGAWSTLGTGLSDKGAALAVCQGDLYVGGDFFSAGGVTVRHIARWDGQSWRDVGGGMSLGFWPTVTSLALHEDRLVVGGWFERAGSVPAARIAVWDGAAWSALGSGLDHHVWAVGSYAGLNDPPGQYHTPGGPAPPPIAVWDGQAWQALGGGVQDQAASIHAHGGALYVGGQFLGAGGGPSFYIARWDNAGTSVDEQPAGGIAADGLRLEVRPDRGVHGARGVELTYVLTHPAHVTLGLYDLEGRSLATLFAGPVAAGAHAASWDGRDGRGRPCARGVYFARLHTERAQVVRRVVLGGAGR